MKDGGIAHADYIFTREVTRDNVRALGYLLLQRNNECRFRFNDRFLFFKTTLTSIVNVSEMRLLNAFLALRVIIAPSLFLFIAFPACVQSPIEDLISDLCSAILLFFIS